MSAVHDASKELGAIHIVSDWASEEGIALGQVATEAKSNEITAIPELLKQIELKDSLITIDAMGCQKEMARDIVDGGGDFVINLKDNQPKLREAIEAHFNKHLKLDLEYLQYRSHETSESSHGRLDERSYFLTKIPPDFAIKKEWPWIKAIGYSLRVTQHADGTETDEMRYYILSGYLSGKRFSEAVRGHWAIESNRTLRKAERGPRQLRSVHRQNSPDRRRRHNVVQRGDWHDPGAVQTSTAR